MRLTLRFSVIALAAALTTAASTSATTIHVPASFSTIQAGIDAAVPGDTVLVAAGTFDDLHYPPGADTTQCVAFMKSGVTLRGAGQGQTIIDALDTGRGIYCFGVTNARIEALTVTNAFAQTYGAGIFCAQASSPSIFDCEITGCGDGGIITNDSSAPDISYCTITNNVAKLGGGIAMEANAAPTVTYSTITGNSAPVAGGVYVKSGSTPVFEHCNIDENFLSTLSGAGGGIAVTNASLTLRNCTVNRNVSTGAGGGIHLSEVPSAVIESTLVQDNTTPSDEYGPGGGIYAEITELDMDYCTITGNSCTAVDSDGGGLFLFFSSATTITNCTFAGNTAPADTLGGGITLFAFASPVIENTIVAYNTLGKGVYCADGTSVPVISCTDIYGNSGGDAFCGTDSGGNFSQDPEFCNMPADDYRLVSTSPCLPGNHPNAAPCGQIGAYGDGNCASAVPEIGPDRDATVTGPFAMPNPLRAGGTIRFSLDRPSRVALAIYDVSGRRVRLLVDSRALGSGDHEFPWDARDDAGHEVSSGVYFCRLEGGVPHKTGRVVLRR